MPEEDIVKSHCNNCGGLRKHKVLYKNNKEDSEKLDEYCSLEWGDYYEMLECCGCEKISMRHKHWFSEDIDDHGRPVLYTTYYPSSQFRQKPDWYHDVGWAFEFGIKDVK